MESGPSTGLVQGDVSSSAHDRGVDTGGSLVPSANKSKTKNNNPATLPDIESNQTGPDGGAELVHSASGHALGKIEHAIPLFKLEIMGLSTMYGMLALMWILGLFNLVVQIILLVVFSPATNSLVGVYSSLFEAMFAIEGILRTVAATLLLLLVIAYPQRIILHLKRTYRPHHDLWFPYWKQALIILILLFMFISPSYSLYEAIVFWIDFQKRDNIVDIHDDSGTSTTTIPLGVLSLLFSFSDTVVDYNTVTSMIVLAMLFLFFGGVYHFLFRSAKASMASTLNLYRVKKVLKPLQPGDDDEDADEDADDDYHEEKGSDAHRSERKGLLFGWGRGRRSSQTRRRDSDASEVVEEEDDEEEEVRENRRMVTSPAYKAHYEALEAQTFMLRKYRKLVSRIQRAIISYKRLTGEIPIWFQFMSVAYLVLLLGFSLPLGMNPSTVPLVSVVTAIRICSMNVTDLLARNTTSYTNVTIPVEGGGQRVINATVHLSVISTIERDELGICSPSQTDRTFFLRTIAIVTWALVELVLFYMIHRLEKKTRLYLLETQYEQTRREILGFHFFRNIARVSWTVVLIGALLASIINPIEIYYVAGGFLQFNNATDEFNVSVIVDPMFQAGVGIGTMGFGNFYSMVVLWIGLLAFAYLPYDSLGVKGWFVGESRLSSGTDKALMASLQRDDYLLLVAKEKEVAQLLEIRKAEAVALAAKEAENNASRQHHRRLQKPKKPPSAPSSSTSLLLFAIRGPDETGADLPKLVQQVGSNVFVLETEILLFHFMHLSYVMAGKRLDASQGIKVTLTEEEKRALLEDSRFALSDHIVDAETDTHVMVFDGPDRVVVAFRGSVSLTNWQTDMNSSEVVCEYVKDVPPDLRDVPPGMAQRAKTMSALPPKVHGGFVKAYDSVRNRLRTLCESLLKDSNKVLFVTGHSLGGGLAVLCAADLAVQLRLPHGRVAATTWGAPKVGTFSFMTRFNRVVRSARRFCMADDLITRLPMDPALKGLTLKGWWHCGTEILLSQGGNMLIRPTPLERFMFSSTVGSPQAHLRMTYATALMLWVVRSHPDYQPDWWIGVVTLFYKKSRHRLKSVPKNLRERLLESVLRSGVTYVYGNRRVRDMTADTSVVTDTTHVKSEALIVEMLGLLRMGKKREFKSRILELAWVFEDEEAMMTRKQSKEDEEKRTETVAGVELEVEDEKDDEKQAVQTAVELAATSNPEVS